MESILNWVIPIGGGLTVGAILIAVGTAIIKGFISRLVNGNFSPKKMEELAERVAKSSTEKLNNLHFTQTIEPIARSEFMKIREEANAIWEEKYALLDSKYNKAVEVIECFAAFFENSIGVSDEKKEALRKAIANMYAPANESPKGVEVVVELPAELEKIEEKNETVIISR